jgi:hypothetical protein
MYRLYKQNDDVAAYVTEFVADTDADVASLPTTVYPGSTCVVADSANVYIFNASYKWVKLG